MKNKLISLFLLTSSLGGLIFGLGSILGYDSFSSIKLLKLFILATTIAILYIVSFIFFLEFLEKKYGKITTRHRLSLFFLLQILYGGIVAIILLYIAR